MDLNKLLKNYLNNREKHERILGRYWATDLYGILTGKSKPEDFFKEKTFTLTDCKNIIEGEMRELILKELLDASRIDYKYREKKEIEIEKGIVLVAEVDFLFKNRILECKSPRYIDSIKDYHKPQLEAQYRVFNLPIFVVYLKERFENKFLKYEPDEKLWQESIKKLKEFHQKLKEIK